MLRPALIAALLATAPAQAAEEFLCRGSDPAWELGGSGGTATLRLGQDRDRSLAGDATELPAEGVLVWRGRDGDAAGDLVATMIKGACIDEVDSRTGSHAAILSLPGRVLVGCCSVGAGSVAAVAAVGAFEPGATARVRGAPGERINVRKEPGAKAALAARLPAGSEVRVAEARQAEGQAWYRIEAAGLDGPGWIRGDLLAAAPEAPAPEPAPAPAPDEPAADWSSALAELLPAIRACVDVTPTKPVTVTKAWLMNRGKAGVRLTNGRGQRLECVVGTKGGKPDSYRTIAKDARPLPGEGEPALSLGPPPRPPTRCRRYVPATVPGEPRPVGTLAYPAC
jgi:hypothetical protein